MYLGSNSLSTRLAGRFPCRALSPLGLLQAGDFHLSLAGKHRQQAAPEPESQRGSELSKRRSGRYDLYGGRTKRLDLSRALTKQQAGLGSQSSL